MNPPKNDELIEDALWAYPLAEVPLDLSKRIMQRVATTPQRNTVPPQVRFRLTWMDYALGFFLALLPVVGLVIWVTLPRLGLLRLELQWQLIQASGLLPVLGISLGVAGGLMLFAFVFSVSFVFRPEPSLR
jgi:hypothetical protein